MKTTKIKAGYRLTVESWENDADNYKTKVVEGLTKPEAAFFVDYVRLFYSKNSPQKGIGNMYDPSDSEIKEANCLLNAVVQKHANTGAFAGEYKDYFFDEDGNPYTTDLMEFAYELGLSGGEFFTRVLDSYKVEYMPEAVLLQDVTDEFN